MYYLIDYENVNERGLKGARYLTPEDDVVLFYSDANCKISNEAIDDFIYSRCRCSCYELVKKGENALDFYICTKAGELLGGGQKTIAIVSADKGYQAVRDYWSKFGSGQRILLQRDIESVIAQLHDDKEKAEIICYKREVTSVSKGVERIAFVHKIWDCTEGKYTSLEFEKKLDIVLNAGKNAEDKRGLYLQCIRQFGRKSGTLIYHALKEKAPEIDVKAGELLTDAEDAAGLRLRIEEAIRPFTPDEKKRAEVAMFILADTTRSDVNNFLMKQYKGAQFLQVKQIIKPFIKNKKGG